MNSESYVKGEAITGINILLYPIIQMDITPLANWYVSYIIQTLELFLFCRWIGIQNSGIGITHLEPLDLTVFKEWL